MADEPSNEGSGRATVALVYHAIGEVKELTKAGFADVQRQLDNLADVPGQVASLKERVGLHEHRITELEQDGTTRRTWFREHLPGLLISALALAVAVLSYVH